MGALVTGVQTCALPISLIAMARCAAPHASSAGMDQLGRILRHYGGRHCGRYRRDRTAGDRIGRAGVRLWSQVAQIHAAARALKESENQLGRESCRERGCKYE